MLLLDRADIEALLTTRLCLEAMEGAMIALAEGDATQPSRTVVPLHQGRDSALFMPAMLGRPPLLGTKVVTIYPGNHERGIASHHGGILVFNADDGRPLALLEGSSVTAIRTAAVTALATRLLAREDSEVLAILGTGVQARSHLDALLAVRPFTQVRVWSPKEASRRRFVSDHPVPAEVTLSSTSTAEEAVRGADVVTTVTGAHQPVVNSAWIGPGTHLNAVGASTASTREVDSDTVARASLFVDLRSAAMEEAGDLLIPIAEGAIGASDIAADLGDVARNAHPGRTAAEEVTLFKSVGLAVQDLAAAATVLEEAERENRGQRIDWA